jgi:hypothetical protein
MRVCVTSPTLAVATALLLAGCATARDMAYSGPACEDAVASVTSRDETSAKLRAEPALARDVDEVRGYMLKNGFRGIHKVGSTRWVCSPYALAPGPGGLVTCTGKMRVCARRS